VTTANTLPQDVVASGNQARQTVVGVIVATSSSVVVVVIVVVVAIVGLRVSNSAAQQIQHNHQPHNPVMLKRLWSSNQLVILR
jgi:hypothetical protein